MTKQMPRDYPEWVNPWKAAEGKRRFAGSVSLARLKRLAPMLEDPEGVASFEAAFSRDALGLTVISLKVTAELPLRCQASLERYFESVNRESELVVAGTDETESDFPSHYEVTMAEDGRIALARIVEDELVLVVPQVPRKPGVGPIRYTTDPENVVEVTTEKQNMPFAALGKLMRDKQDDETRD
ncbi:MAG: hypothetical protein HKO64_03185 [Xanthomonadales bacterium]|nr:hypothetical protein [Xanthomonadales bacterium]NNL94602.1 hypothetical protein [Xanthomonadales bacterium]